MTKLTLIEKAAAITKRQPEKFVWLDFSDNGKVTVYVNQSGYIAKSMKQADTILEGVYLTIRAEFAAKGRLIVGGV
jgi:hypothetical protein